MKTVLMRVGDFAMVRKGWGVQMVYDPQGSANHTGGIAFHTLLGAKHFRGNRLLKHHNLGSGLVTNVGVLAMANDFGWSAQLNLSTLGLANQHFSGKGTTGAAATDIKIETISTNGGQTAVAGTQTLVSAANLQKYQTVATIAYSGTEAVTEWGLMSSATLTATTGSPFTAGTATSGTVTATPLTASSATVRGQQQTIFENTSAANPSWGLVLSNTTGVVTVPAWYRVSTGAAGDTPANTNAYTIRPVMWDHKVFSAINVVSGDSIQFTYTLTVTAGG